MSANTLFSISTSVILYLFSPLVSYNSHLFGHLLVHYNATNSTTVLKNFTFSWIIRSLFMLGLIIAQFILLICLKLNYVMRLLRYCWILPGICVWVEFVGFVFGFRRVDWPKIETDKAKFRGVWAEIFGLNIVY